ncbi:GIY-YIG nuclease family protein [Pustulibacterium marinum]|uniref:GIY-YIG nuclease family protein n=1 Tax=Pustulibacterium marinum TaxID=1224947 RepID=UPI000B8A2565|nr:GIY-YIG nuclease family protein [Pustulibacterium marinum]
MKTSYIYILTNKNKTTLYIGVTSNLKHRIDQHNKKRGAIFTTKYNLTELIYVEEFNEIEQAIRREKQLKNWRREWKWNLIKQKNPNLETIYIE